MLLRRIIWRQEVTIVFYNMVVVGDFNKSCFSWLRWTVPDWNWLNSRSVGMRLWVCPGQRSRVWVIGERSSMFYKDGKSVTNLPVSWSCFPIAYFNNFFTIFLTTIMTTQYFRRIGLKRKECSPSSTPTYVQKPITGVEMESMNVKNSRSFSMKGSREMEQ